MYLIFFQFLQFPYQHALTTALLVHHRRRARRRLFLLSILFRKEELVQKKSLETHRKSNLAQIPDPEKNASKKIFCQQLHPGQTPVSVPKEGPDASPTLHARRIRSSGRSPRRSANRAYAASPFSG